MNAPMFTEENNDTKPKVLIVDDNEGNVIAMQAVLGDLDIDILTATLAERAIYLAIVHDLALIIMDVHMPDMDGFETAERIRMSERSKHVPIMFVTGVKRSKDEVARGYNLGAVDYLLKPVDAEILRAKVGAFLDIYGHRLALEKDHELLKVKNQKLREFAHIASHDLKAPLRQIAMCGQELAEELEADGSNQAREHVVYICSAVTRLQSLIGSLLNFATLDHTPLAFGKIDLKSMLEAVLGDFKNDLSEAQASVEVTDLPQIEGSEVQLQEVFHNLIGNALKYRRPDTPLNISISAEVAEEVLVDIATVDLR
ncbi:MAG: response regulator [Myxococcota bacterium]|nr:response regulator [Myxococcota bacterium]